MSDIELDPRWIEYKMEQYKEKESQIMNDKSVVEAQNKNELKCPFCQRELEYCGTYIDGTKKLWCDNCKLFGDNRLFEKLIRTRKALDIAKDRLDTVRQYYRGTAVIGPNDIAAYCDIALEQITALEQKDRDDTTI